MAIISLQGTGKRVQWVENGFGVEVGQIWEYIGGDPEHIGT